MNVESRTMLATQSASYNNNKRSLFELNSSADTGSDPCVSQLQAGSKVLRSSSAFQRAGRSFGSSHSRPRVSCDGHRHGGIAVKGVDAIAAELPEPPVAIPEFPTGVAR
ncbi:MAG TPA: hypothetical protein VHG30_00425 [Microvirga sp.]|nr:hypothetical protein [Microvirga sp.]